ncbi:MAG TPA: phosphoglycerate mutase family protein [Planctomycetota bacterium]|nr:phosphoglycerate mutase family protein [Planctomycetota bacterium]
MKTTQDISRRGIVGAAAALAFGSALVGAQEPAGKPQETAPASPPQPRPRSVILVRHAEKAADDPRDPTLSDVGKLRAAALLRLLGETRVTHVWTSEFKRTKDTVRAIAEKGKVVPVEFPARDPLGLAARLQALPAGSISLVVGHSNTLPAVAKALGAALSNLAGGTDLREDEYDRFVVITLPPEGEACALLELRYGA